MVMGVAGSRCARDLGRGSLTTAKTVEREERGGNGMANLDGTQEVVWERNYGWDGSHRKRVRI